MCVRTFVKTTSLLALCWLFQSLPALAQGVGFGSIAGTIQDPAGAVLPGATVILSNPGTIGGNQEAISDERGTYQFIRLVPSSTYSVRAELSGFRTAVSTNVAVNASVTARIDLTLEVGAVSETITVSGAAPLLDTTTTFDQAVLERRTLDTLPSGNDPWSISRLVPAITMNKYDVGGSESFANARPFAHGNNINENRYLIDGMDIGYANGSGSSNLNYFDTFMFQEINVQTGNAPAENSQGGVVFNFITKTGTNDFNGSFRFVGTNEHLQSDNLSPDVRSQLLAAVPAAVLAANPNVSANSKILDMFDVGLSVSGPIVRDRLWFTATGKLQPMRVIRIGSYNLDGTQLVAKNRMTNGSFKVSWQSSPGSQLHFTFNRNSKGEFNRSGAGFSDSRATTILDQKIKIEQLKYTAILSPRLVVDSSASLQHGDFPTRPQSEVQPGDVPRFDSVTQTRTVAAANYAIQPQWRGVFNASVTYIAGNHNVKSGFQWNRSMYRSKSWSTSHYPSGLEAIYRNGAPDSVRTYNTPSDFSADYLQRAVFIQDKWTPLRKLTLNLGLRVEQDRGWIPATCQEQTIFINAECFPAIEDIPDWLDVTPRFGLIYDIFGNGKTALKVGLNRYNVASGAGLPLLVNPIRIANDTRPWNDRNGDLIPQLDELGASTGFGLGTTTRFDPNLKRRYSNEYSLEVEQQLFGSVVASVAYYHRDVRNGLGSINLAVPRDSYVPLQVTERASGRQVTVYNQAPAIRGMFDILLTNFPELDSRFDGVDFIVNKRMSNRWMMMGGLSLGRNIGDITMTERNPGADMNNPNFTFRRGPIDNDVPVTFKVAGSYELPYAITLGASAQHFTGFPENTTVLVNSQTVALTQVSQSLLVEPRGTTRLPDVNMVDVSVRRRFRVGGRSFEPAMDIFNITNSAPVQGRITQLGPTYGRASSILLGRLVRFGLSVDF